MPTDGRTVVAVNPKMQWTMENELLRHILHATETTAWLNMSPKKGQEASWRRMEPKLFSPSFLEENQRPKEQQAMDIDELKDFLNKPRK